MTIKAILAEARAMPWQEHVLFALSGAYLLAALAFLPVILLSTFLPRKER